MTARLRLYFARVLSRPEVKASAELREEIEGLAREVAGTVGAYAFIGPAIPEEELPPRYEVDGVILAESCPSVWEQ